ncbi:MAG: CPBP family intramembrane glutamic endopeptidase, partial [Agathobacter sp.]|nr:CPBP family intramembrane glutamic endopeptidase [Agathobacter sp.]
ILSIFMGIILTFITIKSESIWPAAILHAVNNASPSILGLYINEENLSGWRGDTIFAFVLTMLPMIAVATFFVSHMSRRKKTYPIDFRTITS